MTIKEIRERSGLSQGAFCKRYGIPKGTLCHWESGERKPPSYVLNLLERVVEQDKITGYNWQQIAKVLSTYGIVANDTHEIILNLYDRGKNAKEISEITGYAETTVHAYLPRVRPAYNENISENAKRIKKYRQNK